jgi:hypothetical protein
MINLGRLKKVDVREAWITEDKHFTPWLASDENIELLSEALGLELEVEAQEKQVGPFRADILCKDVGSDAYVLIENQLEKTDHRHLGQVITYAAGLKTAYIVWIATKFQEEHRAAIDWLNTISDDNYKFFGLELELWSIGDSQYAPKFNIVSKPNQWSRKASGGLKNIESQGLTDTKSIQLNFWEYLSPHLEMSGIISQKSVPRHWNNISIGRSGIKITNVVNSKTSTIGVSLYMHQQNAKELFNGLYEQRDSIHSELGYELDWQELPDKIASRILIEKTDSSLWEKESWDSYSGWLVEKTKDFMRVFKHRIQDI